MVFVVFFSGDGKTHYVMKELKKKWHNESIVYLLMNPLILHKLSDFLEGLK